jgi:hypothetical protein
LISIRFGGFWWFWWFWLLLLVLAVLVVFGRAPWGTPYHFLLISITHGSPNVPATISFKSHQIPHSFLELLSVTSFGFPSDFPQFTESAPCNFLVNSIMFLKFPEGVPYHFSSHSHQITHRLPCGFPSEALDAGYFS